MSRAGEAPVAGYGSVAIAHHPTATVAVPMMVAVNSEYPWPYESTLRPNAGAKTTLTAEAVSRVRLSIYAVLE